MSVEYLFRIDQAKDNDVYFETTKKQVVNTAYAGVEIKIGQGWVPDLVRVSHQDSPEACILTLIELETSKPEALKSSRKYLPESSAHMNGKKGYARHPETLRWRGKLKALYGRHELLVCEMAARGYRHRSLLTKREATGSAKQNIYVDRPKKQIVILRDKGCQCDV